MYNQLLDEIKGIKLFDEIKDTVVQQYSWFSCRQLNGYLRNGRSV